MAQVADPSPSSAPSPKQLGRQLRSVRKQKGLSRSEVARSAGLTRRELANYERGKVTVPESDLWCLAGSCGVDVGELLPNRDPLLITSELSSLTVGNSIRHLRASQERDGVLREYLSMIYELRNLPPGSRVPLREEDLATLADALGGMPELIEQRLVELIGASREEAARLRAMILPPLSLPAVGTTASADAYAQRPATFDPAAAAEQYFSTPRAEDPFGPPPSDDTLAPAPHIDAFLGNATDDPFTPADPFAAMDPNPSGAVFFAPPSGAPLSTAPPEADPFAGMPGEDDPFAGLVDTDPFAVLPAEAGFDPASPEASIANPFAHLPSGMEIDDPFGTPRYPAADTRPFSADAALAMDPFGAAFETSDMPLDTADLLPTTGRVEEAPAEAGVPSETTAADTTLETDDATDDIVDDTVDDGIDEGWSAVAASMVEAAESTDSDPDALPTGDTMVEPYGDSLGESTTSLGESWSETGGEDTGGFGPLESSPFGIAVPSIDDLLASVRDETQEFPAGDGWREVPADSAPIVVDPADYSDYGDAGVTPEAADEFDALSSAFGVTTPVHGDQGYDRDDDAIYSGLAYDTTEQVEGTDESEPVADDTEGNETPGAFSFGDEPEPATNTFVLETLGAEIEELEGEDEYSTAAPTTSATSAWIDDPVDETAAEDTFTETPDVDSIDEYLVPIAWSHTVHHRDAGAGAEPEVEPEPELVFVTAGPDWQVGGIYPATTGADGTLSLRRADVRWALADITSEGDCTIEAVVDFTSGAGFGILFRASVDESDRLTSYSFDIEPAYSGGSYLVRQWIDSEQHWTPLAQAPVADPSLLYGHRTLRLTLVGDELQVAVDDETVLTVADLAQCSTDVEREPCHGTRLGVQAWSTTEVTVDTFRVAHH